MLEVMFLSVLAIFWLAFATFQDLKKREIANWINFSLLIFALGFRFFYSLFSDSFAFFYQGLIGLAIFFILSNLLYYSRFFGGGDFKLLISLGAILPFSESFLINIKIFAVFFLFFFFIGAFYTILSSIYLGIANFKKFRNQLSKQIGLIKTKKFFYLVFVLGLAIMVLGFLEPVFFALGILIFTLPYLYVYTKAVDESCLIKKIDAKELVAGDLLYKDVKIGKKLIKAGWDGLKETEIKQLRKKNKRVLVRYGIPFTPVFLISFLALFYLWQAGLLEALLGFLWNSSW
jgi:Flp pilus assembly protein protease CpaA